MTKDWTEATQGGTFYCHSVGNGAVLEGKKDTVAGVAVFGMGAHGNQNLADKDQSSTLQRPTSTSLAPEDSITSSKNTTNLGPMFSLCRTFRIQSTTVMLLKEDKFMKII